MQKLPLVRPKPPHLSATTRPDRLLSEVQDVERLAKAKTTAVRGEATGAAGLGASWSCSSGDLAEELQQRVVASVDDALLERDDRVVGDVDAFGADFGAAFRDVAESEAALVRNELGPVERVERMHLEARDADQEPRPEVAAVQSVIAQDVTHVLAEEALDALAKLGDAVDVRLANRPVRVGLWRERWDPFVDLVVPGDVGDEVADDWKGSQRLDYDRLVFGEVIQPCLAHQPRGDR